MSTSDSDCSIDWLASDEDICNSPKRSSPQLTKEIPIPSSSSSAAEAAMCCSGFPTSCSQCGAQRKRRVICTNGSQCWAGFFSVVSPVQGSDGVFPQQILHVEAECCPARKRTCGDGSDAQMDINNNKPFSQKCLQLQCYVPPLASILRGLRSGRYSERLSSFQESVAMDRIQRIMGVLQNPNMGEKFLSIILKIEEMLQHWFPHIKPKVTQTEDGTPAKKRKRPNSSSPPPSDSYRPTQHNWLHRSTTCSLRLPGTTLSNVASCLDVTQDNAVSSSTDLHPRPPSPHCRPPPFKISSPFLERLLRAKESIITTRTAADGGVVS